MADELEVAAAPEAPAGEITQPSGENTGEITQPLETPAAPDFEKLFAEPEPPTSDPNAPPVAPVVPPEFQQALTISEHVKDATQLAGAITLADQVIKVQNGQAPISGLLENFRAQNGPAFEKMAREELIPYVEAITGLKLLDPSKAGETKSPEQQRIDALEAQFNQARQQEQQQVIQRQVQQAQTVLVAKADEALKGTWLEGKGKDLLSQIAPHMGMTDEQATKALLSGNTAMVDKAVKALMDQKEAEGRAYSRWKIAESRKLKTALPAGPGNPRPVPAGELPEDATMAQKVQFLQSN